MTPKTYQAHAAAKINLALHVTGQRPDGYHDLDSLVVFARPGDVIRAAAGATEAFSITGEFAADLSASDDNLVLKAKALFEQAFAECDLPELEIELVKHLPIASGIGGGSADAAAMLGLLATIAGVSGDGRIIDVARQLGADVPMCVSDRPKRVRGLGDEFDVVSGLPPCNAVLINPLIPVLTPEVFQKLAQRTNSPLPVLPDGWGNVAELATYLQSTRNDLRDTAAALVPEIADLENLVAATDGCHFARMSGSGATVFGLFATAEDTETAALTLRDARPNDWIKSVQIVDSTKFEQA